MSAFQEETVLSVHHWTDRLFSFTTTRNRGFRFRNGQFSMIGLPVDGKPLLRAYSIASPNYDDKLEFFSIKVPDGPLTSRLLHVVPGDKIIIGQKATGTLLLDNLLPGKHLYLLGTGTGLAPFLSLIRDPETYEQFEKVILVHGTREVAELAYADMIEKELPEDEFLGDYVREKVIFATSPELRVPAYVLVPKGLKGPAPAIVDLHSHGGMFLFGIDHGLRDGRNGVIEDPEALTFSHDDSFAARAESPEIPRAQ